MKVWDKREFKDLDGDVELGTRNIKIALRRLRKFARTGAPEELDLDGTIMETAHKGYLDIKLRPERHNTVKVLPSSLETGHKPPELSRARLCHPFATSDPDTGHRDHCDMRLRTDRVHVPSQAKG